MNTTIKNDILKRERAQIREAKRSTRFSGKNVSSGSLVGA